MVGWEMGRQGRLGSEASFGFGGRGGTLRMCGG